MAYQEFDVVVTTKSFDDFGVKAGSVGTVVEVWGDGEYEIEFCNGKGETLAMFPVSGQFLAASARIAA